MFDLEMKDLVKRGLNRVIRDRSSVQGKLIKLGNHELLNFSSNDYLGFSSDEKLIAASIEALRKYGFGSGSSRLLSGGTLLHKELEDALARFKSTDRAIIFNSGYAANTGVIPVIAGEGDAAFSDELNHASIIDGCRLSKAEKHVYRHADLSDLRDRLRYSDASRKIIITDTIFSMDGDMAPLREIYDLCVEEGAILYIDDAHGTGVLGEGKGALVHFGLEAEERIIQMGTLSKAIGAFGAFIASDHTTIDYLISRARPFIFSTALPPVVAAAAKTALQLISLESNRIATLLSNTQMLHKGLEEIGVNKGMSSTQIIPLICDNLETAVRLSDHLLSRKIYAPVIRPPAVKEPRVRVSVTAMHSANDVRMLIEAVEDFFDEG